METFIQDLRYGARTLIKNPSFTVVAVLALALGIGANTAIFSVINTVLLKALPYNEPDRLVYMWEIPSDAPSDQFLPASPMNFRDWREQARSFTGIAGRVQRNFNLTVGGDPERIQGEMVTDNYFQVLDVKPLAGRFFAPAEADSGHDHVVVLSNALWTRRFASDRSIVGRTILLNDEPYTVIGVAPDDHRKTFELWTPLVMAMTSPDRGWHSLQVLGRMKPGVTLDGAKAEMATVATRLSTQFPMTNRGWRIAVIPVHEMVVKNIRPALLVLACAVGFVLLIACANVANLLLARVTVRQREIAIRTALGAGRWRLVRQMLTESVLLSCLGGLIGVLLAVWGTDLISKLQLGVIPRASEVAVDRWVLLFALGLSVATGLLFGLLPALQASKSDLSGPLKDGSRAISGGVRGRRIRSGLVLAEVALALLLLVGAGLMIRSFASLQGVEPGFDTDNVLTVQFSLPEMKYSDSAKQATIYQSLIERIGSIPGITSAAMVSQLPLGQGGPAYLFSVEGRPLPNPAEADAANMRYISPNYFATMKIPLLKGREFTWRDRFESQSVAIVNETMAKKLWPGEDPVGKRLTVGIPVGLPTDSIQWITVVGVAADVHHASLEAEAGLQLYIPFIQNGGLSMSLVARTSGDPHDVVSALRREVGAIDPELPLSQIRSYEEILSTSLAQPRLYMLLLVIFAGVALLLAAIGIYGVIAQTVTQRTHEIGIRMALGAGRGAVLAMVVRQGMLVAGIGVLVGLGGAFALTRLMEALLYGVSATDPYTFIGVALLLALVALVACYIPARRAAGIDPMNALRYE